MPRRNRNANALVISPDMLADQISQLARDLDVIPAPRCAACGTNPATCGEYCALCKGVITLDARRAAIARAVSHR
jgi:hypothetical protein